MQYYCLHDVALRYFQSINCGSWGREYPTPVLTGRYPVGTVSLELIDDSRIDQAAPTPQPRSLMVSVFYPTSQTTARSANYSFAPYFSSSKTAAAFDVYLGNSTEIPRITTQSYHHAPITSGDFPVLIFSHGLGSSRLMHTAQLETLAGQGWIIVAPRPSLRCADNGIPKRKRHPDALLGP